jgi:hypothetical protein
MKELLPLFQQVNERPAQQREQHHQWISEITEFGKKV